MKRSSNIKDIKEIRNKSFLLEQGRRKGSKNLSKSPTKKQQKIDVLKLLSTSKGKEDSRRVTKKSTKRPKSRSKTKEIMDFLRKDPPISGLPLNKVNVRYYRRASVDASIGFFMLCSGYNVLNFFYDILVNNATFCSTYLYCMLKTMVFTGFLFLFLANVYFPIIHPRLASLSANHVRNN